MAGGGGKYRMPGTASGKLFCILESDCQIQSHFREYGTGHIGRVIIGFAMEIVIK